MSTVTVEQIAAIRCAYADLIGARQAQEQMDFGAHDWKAHDLSIAELETEFPFVLEPVHEAPPISKGQIDPDDAPEGCIAVPYTDCGTCALTDIKDCHKGECFADERKDGRSVQFKRRTE
jgi:hypothetical protein